MVKKEQELIQEKGIVAKLKRDLDEKTRMTESQQVMNAEELTKKVLKLIAKCESLLDSTKDNWQGAAYAEQAYLDQITRDSNDVIVVATRTTTELQKKPYEKDIYNKEVEKGNITFTCTQLKELIDKQKKQIYSFQYEIESKARLHFYESQHFILKSRFSVLWIILLALLFFEILTLLFVSEYPWAGSFRTLETIFANTFIGDTVKSIRIYLGINSGYNGFFKSVSQLQLIN